MNHSFFVLHHSMNDNFSTFMFESFQTENIARVDSYLDKLGINTNKVS